MDQADVANGGRPWCKGARGLQTAVRYNCGTVTSVLELVDVEVSVTVTRNNRVAVACADSDSLSDSVVRCQCLGITLFSGFLPVLPTMPISDVHRKAVEEVITALRAVSAGGRGKRLLADMFLDLPDKEAWAEYYEVRSLS